MPARCAGRARQPGRDGRSPSRREDPRRRSSPGEREGRRTGCRRPRRRPGRIRMVEADTCDPEWVRSRRARWRTPGRADGSSGRRRTAWSTPRPTRRQHPEDAGHDVARPATRGPGLSNCQPASQAPPDRRCRRDQRAELVTRSRGRLGETANGRRANKKRAPDRIRGPFRCTLLCVWSVARATHGGATRREQPAGGRGCRCPPAAARGRPCRHRRHRRRHRRRHPSGPQTIRAPAYFAPS